MPDITRIDLSRYRLQKAKETLASAKRDMDAEDYASANNRAYYAIFHAMRAVLALNGEDYKKHSAVISRFTLNYLKPEAQRIQQVDFQRLSDSELQRLRGLLHLLGCGYKCAVFRG